MSLSGLHAAETKYSQDRIRPTDWSKQMTDSRGSRSQKKEERGAIFAMWWHKERAGFDRSQTLNPRAETSRNRESSESVPGKQHKKSQKQQKEQGSSCSGETAANGATFCLVLRS